MASISARASSSSCTGSLRARVAPCSVRPAMASRGASLVVRAEDASAPRPPPPPPAGVSMPKVLPEAGAAMFGFVDNAERINSRAAMIGFFALLAVEGISGQPFLQLIGWQVGNGINIGF